MIFLGGSAFFQVIAGLIFLKYLMKDDSENRDNLPKAVIASFIGGAIQQTGVYLAMSGYIGGGVTDVTQGDGIMGFVFAMAINVLLTFYFYKVMVKYAASK